MLPLLRKYHIFYLDGDQDVSVILIGQDATWLHVRHELNHIEKFIPINTIDSVLLARGQSE